MYLMECYETKVWVFAHCAHYSFFSYHPKYRRVGVKKGFAIVIERIFQIKSRLMMATL